MDWATLAGLILQYGLPFAEKLFQKWTTAAVPTQADFDELRAMAQQTAQDRMKLALAAAGIPLTDPKAILLLSMTI